MSSTSESSSSSFSSSKEDSSSSTSSSSSSTSSSIPDEVDPLLEEAIAKMGVNYTANVYYGGEITYRHICTDDGIYKDYFDDYDRVEFYGDRVIYKQYQNAWGSSGFVYVNDYAYYFDMDEEGIVSIGEEPYTDFYGNPYYRDWMNKTYLPLVTINPLHWTLNGDGSYEADAIGLDVINDIFYEDSPLSCNITLTEDGYVDAINFDCAAAGYSDGTCTAKVIDIGTTNYTGPQA